MPKMIHFEIGVDDPERAVEFYAKAFGWKSQKWEGPMEYWLIDAGSPEEPGINGGFARRTPDSLICNTIGVDNIDVYIDRIEAAGGEIIVPKQLLPGVGWLAYFRDSEGNVLGVIQDDM